MNSASAETRAHPRSNRLAGEKSLYLLQHAHNPVDWFPWGEEAFAEARRQDKPVFLSIGYATCHWCHVMERESFDDPEVARLINTTFVPVKVDREERPDVDHVYMTVCQTLTGHGGWPLTVLLTPDQEPFFAGTYFPKQGRPGLPGLLDLIPHVRRLWLERRGEVSDSAAEIAAAVREAALDSTAGALSGAAASQRAFEQLRDRYDAGAGGFGTAPKFPTPHNFNFLLRYGRRTGDPRALEMVRESLRRMRRGGIYDQIGFGFHRYSTDAHWRVPHFEKMLYDQALMATACIEAFQASGEPEFRRTAEEVFEYVRRDLLDPDGAFYSAEDADSEGVEGKFYLWRTDEVRSALTPGDAAHAIGRLNLRDDGSFVDTHGHMPAGGNVPFLDPGSDEPGFTSGSDGQASAGEWDRVRPLLLAWRDRRPRPLRDDKILADWNGLMAAALAVSARVLDRPELAEAAACALEFILGRMSRPDGRLYHRYRDGEAAVDGLLDDYAFVTKGLIETYQSTGRARFLEEAVRLADRSMTLFWDAEAGGFFMTATDGERLLFRGKEVYDGAVPSGNSVSLENLLCLAALTGREEYSATADRLVRSFAGAVERMPAAHTRFLGALEMAAGSPMTIMLSGRREDPVFREMVRVAGRASDPGSAWIWLTQDEEGERVRRLVPHLAQVPRTAEPTAHVCRGRSCQAPLRGPDALAGFLADG